MAYVIAEYIWLDGTQPSALLRSKTRVLEPNTNVTLDCFPDWGFDGSSTNQATGDKSDCILKPVSFVNNTFDGDNHYLVMCEVFDKDDNPHATNTRAILRDILDKGADKQDCYFGFEQEYTLFELDEHPLGWPKKGYPGPQGPYYCGVGASRISGRALVLDHLHRSTQAGLLIYGINAEVMLGQWEYQIGYRGFDEPCDPLTTTDHMWYSAWLLDALSEQHGVRASFENKPIKGDWNGAGCHTNFSTAAMRNPKTGRKAIDDAIKALEANHQAHIPIYGHALDERLTGLHESCDINTF